MVYKNKAFTFAISALAFYLYELQHTDRYKSTGMLALVHIHIQWIVGIIFIILYCVTILGLVLVIITENRNPLKTIPWVIVLLLAPGIGLLFYFFFGQDNRKQRIISRRTYKRIMKRPQEGKLPQDACSVPAPYQPLVTLLTNSNQSSLLYGSDITIYTNGADKFQRPFTRDCGGNPSYTHPILYLLRRRNW